jgi:hypothetical protein
VDVTVIIPAYNRLWSLPKAIASCQNTKCRTEIIVVDDGSTDGTWQWLQSQKDVKGLYQKNQGQTYAINAGIRSASGRYVRFLDSDDYLCEGAIDKQFEKAEETGAQLVYGRVDDYVYETGAVFEYPELPVWQDFLEIQLSSQYGSHFLGMLFHHGLIEQVPRRPDFAYREDRMFLLEIGLLEPKTAKVEGCVGYWVKHNGQMQANYQGMKSVVTNYQHLAIFKKVLGELESKGTLCQTRKNAACTTLWPLAHWIAKDHLEESIQVVKWIYALNPGFVPPEKGLLGLFYKRLGFSQTEKLLRWRRFLLNR